MLNNQYYKPLNTNALYTLWDGKQRHKILWYRNVLILQCIIKYSIHHEASNNGAFKLIKAVVMQLFLVGYYNVLHYSFKTETKYITNQISKMVKVKLLVNG